MSDDDSLIPYEALRREVAAALHWPSHLVVWDGESFEQIGPSADGEIHGLVSLSVPEEKNLGTGEDTAVDFTTGLRVRTQMGARMLKVEARVEHFGHSANDLASKLERRLRGEGVQERLLFPEDEQPPISLLEYNVVRDAPFTANGHVLSAAILEIDAMVGYAETDESASPDYFETASATYLGTGED